MSDIERAVLGAVIVDSRHWAEVQELRGHLVYPYHPIFEGLQTLSDRGLPLDLVSLKNHLVATDTLSTSGGIEFVAGLIEGLPPLRRETISGWVEQIKTASRIRRMAQEASKLVEATKDASRSLESLLGQFQAAAYDCDPGTLSGRLYGPKELRRATAEEMDRIASHDGMAGYSYGIPDIDSLTSGLQAGQSIVLGARPSVGKSSLALQIADHVAFAGGTVAFFSLEMEAGQLSLIRACARARVTKYHVSTLPADHPWIQRLTLAINEQAETPLYVDKLATNTLSAIKARASRIKAEHGLALIVIDYLQLLSGDTGSKGGTRNEELSVISRGIKRMAGDLGCAVITCAQLNRQAAGPSAEPHMGNLRDSGAIEADADVVILLNRIGAGLDRTLPVAVDAIVEKNRTGAVGIVPLMFEGKFQTFTPRTEGEYL